MAEVILRKKALRYWLLTPPSPTHTHTPGALPPERGDADERRGGLADSRHPQRHQHADPQGEDPNGGAVYEGGAREDAEDGEHGVHRGQGEGQQQQLLPRPSGPAAQRAPGPLPQGQQRLTSSGALRESHWHHRER